MPTNSQSVILDHIYKVVLEFDDAEIARLHQLKYRKIGRLKNLSLSQLDQEKKDNDITGPIYKQMKKWMWYYKVHQPSYDEIMAIDDTVFDDMDLEELEYNFTQMSFKPSTPAASLHIDLPKLEMDFNDIQPTSSLPPPTSGTTTATSPSSSSSTLIFAQRNHIGTHLPTTETSQLTSTINNINDPAIDHTKNNSNDSHSTASTPDAYDYGFDEVYTVGYSEANQDHCDIDFECTKDNGHDDYTCNNGLEYDNNNNHYGYDSDNDGCGYEPDIEPEPPPW